MVWLRSWGGGFLRRPWRFFSSIKLAVALIIAILLGLLLAALFPQIPTYIAVYPWARIQWLADIYDRYGPRTELYHILGLFEVHRSFWFKLPLAALALNTAVCTLNRFKSVWRRVAQPRVRMPEAFFESASNRASLSATSVEGAVEAIVSTLSQHRYRAVAEEEGRITHLYFDANRFGGLGTLITHASLLPLLVGALWGDALGFEGAISTLILMTAGLVLSFYFPHKRIWARVEADGEGARALLAGLTRRSEFSFAREFAELIEEIEGGLAACG